MPPKFLIRFVIALALLGLGGPAFAAAPKKQNANIYQRLWSTSPFTVKPPPPPPGETGPGPLEDFTLASVSQTQEGWFVVLLNKKKREERIRIVPGASPSTSEGFQVLEVKQDPASYKSTRVQLSYKGDTGWVGYEEKYLALKKAAAPARPTPTRPGTPPRPTTPAPPARATATATSGKPATPSSRQPRVRRVPTPPQR